MEEEKANHEAALSRESGESGPEAQPAGPAAEVNEQPEDLRAQLEAKEKENRSLQDKHLRLYAEFENFKKRAARDREELSKYANEQLLKEFLPVLDNLERAIFHTKELKEYEKILEGLDLILKQFREVLGKFGITPIESRLKAFDPAVHEAMGQLESESHEPGTILEEIQRGYRLNDRVLRPAMVIVSKKSGQDAEKESGTPNTEPD